MECITNADLIGSAASAFRNSFWNQRQRAVRITGPRYSGEEGGVKVVSGGR